MLIPVVGEAVVGRGRPFAPSGPVTLVWQVVVLGQSATAAPGTWQAQVPTLQVRVGDSQAGTVPWCHCLAGAVEC